MEPIIRVNDDAALIWVFIAKNNAAPPSANNGAVNSNRSDAKRKILNSTAAELPTIKKKSHTIGGIIEIDTTR